MVLRVPKKDKEQTNDQGSNKEREIKIEQTVKDLNRVREAYFNFIQTQKKKTTRTKHTMWKRTVREDCNPVQMSKLQKEVKEK